MEKTLTLRKCAYLFDSTYGNYFYGTREQHAKRNATQKTLKEYYDSNEKRLEKIPYTIAANGSVEIMLNGEPHRLNDLQIAHIDGELDNIINHRREISAETVEENAKHFHQWTRNSLYSNKFKTLEFEFFTGPDDLGYIRANFKGRSEKFIIDDRTGELFTSGEYGQHRPTSAKTILMYLGISSEAAKKEFYEIISIITEA